MGLNSRTGMFSGSSIKLAVAALLVVYLTFIIIHGIRDHKNPANVVADHGRKFIHWTWLSSNNPNTDYGNCRFENYIFGHPVKQTDPCFISAFSKTMLSPPPPLEEQNPDPNTIKNEIPSNIEKVKWIEKLIIENPAVDMKGKPGFFIECGANDGTFISPTIRLEKQYKWTGLLIEANPIPFKSLLEKKRNAWAVNAALCTTPHPQQITFYTNPQNTGISSMNARVEYGVSVNVTVQCIPLYTILLSLHVDTIDFLSLDVEGLELAVLETLPFDKIKFKVMAIEYNLIPGKQQALKDFLEPRGYKYVKDVRDSLTDDSLFVHESLYELASKTTI